MVNVTKARMRQIMLTTHPQYVINARLKPWTSDTYTVPLTQHSTFLPHNCCHNVSTLAIDYCCRRLADIDLRIAVFIV